ncbi:MAG: hypothetical protein HY517_03995 [Candidatus Aenigmarchaeota archaeon]|nr:hypothetical protein [Candidatus Aenigmarchaeota archaeon]
MAHIWKTHQKRVDDPKDYRIHESTLVNIFEGPNRYFALYGQQMAEKGSGAWKAYMSQHRRLLRRNRHIDKSQRERRINELASSAALPTAQTDFLALSAGRARQIMLLIDRKDPTCEVFPARKTIHVFPKGYRRNENYLGDAAGKMRMHSADLSYDGSLPDALSEFEQAGYSFIFHDGVWRTGYFDADGNPALQKEEIYPRSELPLAKVLDRLNSSSA